MVHALVLHSLNNLLILLTLIINILYSCVIFMGFFVMVSFKYVCIPKLIHAVFCVPKLGILFEWT